MRRRAYAIPFINLISKPTQRSHPTRCRRF
uniref:Uncharacterized protein n=1 Tax=Myoviridae sp. ctnjE18 TaxID=2827706 RepID=A0A8S5SUM1_9CAUD|nr:MAG TPA: hypothetical protein [Myoviridae sp. ctnjE18]